MEKTGFFEEAPGIKSMSRLQMFWGTVYAYIFLTYYALATKEEIDILALIIILLTFAAAPKVISKFVEKVPTIGK